MRVGLPGQVLADDVLTGCQGPSEVFFLQDHALSLCSTSVPQGQTAGEWPGVPKVSLYGGPRPAQGAEGHRAPLAPQLLLCRPRSCSFRKEGLHTVEFILPEGRGTDLCPCLLPGRQSSGLDGPGLFGQPTRENVVGEGLRAIWTR